jgi:hypothetical protein
MTTKTTYQTTREASRKIGATIPKSEHKIPRKDLARIAGVDIDSHFVATTCPLTAEFLDHVIRANTVNRPRNWEHCGQLSGAIQVDYQPCLTDFAVTVDGRTCNGGHSGAAIAQSFFPSDVWEPMGWVIGSGWESHHRRQRRPDLEHGGDYSPACVPGGGRTGGQYD